jgi:hypothetical protein
MRAYSSCRRSNAPIRGTRRRRRSFTTTSAPRWYAAGPISPAERTDRNFLGPIIVTRSQASGVFEVVDGQQRLVTLAILLAVLRDSLPTDNDFRTSSSSSSLGPRAGRGDWTSVPGCSCGRQTRIAFLKGYIRPEDNRNPRRAGRRGGKRSLRAHPRRHRSDRGGHRQPPRELHQTARDFYPDQLLCDPNHRSRSRRRLRTVSQLK